MSSRLASSLRGSSAARPQRVGDSSIALTANPVMLSDVGSGISYRIVSSQSKRKNSSPVQRASTAAAGQLRLPPLKALQAFDAVTRHTSFARGGEELGVTPSAVSHHIQQLERFLGVALFDRRGGRATLTEAGRAYATEVKAAFAILLNASTLVAPNASAGHLVIACSPSFAAKWLQPRLQEFLRTSPDIKVRLWALSPYDALDKERCDVAIVYGQAQAAAHRNEPLLTERLRPLCNPMLAEAAALRAPPDLARATLIHSINALSWFEYLRRIRAPSFRPANELWINPSSIAIDAAVAGLGVILESELLAAHELSTGRLIAPFADESDSVEVSSYFLVRLAAQRNRAANRFEQWLRDAIARDTR
jgi:LysR family glycine cleavage system transcriptional activator